MTIQDWGAIGELVGGAAVIVTLVFLAMQIRQNTRTMRISLTAEHEARAADFNLQMVQAPDVHDLRARVVDEGLEQLSDLSTREQTLLEDYANAVFCYYQTNFLLAQGGMMDAPLWGNRRRTLRGLIDAYPMFEARWQVAKTTGILLSSFTSDVESADPIPDYREAHRTGHHASRPI